MRKLTVHKKPYYRKGYHRTDGTYVKPAHVEGTTFKIKDRGTPGRNPNRWFNPQKPTGWRKKQSSSTRRRKLMASTDKRFTLRKRNVQAGRRAQALSNVQQDKETKELAKRDAIYFFKVAKKHKA